MPPEWHSATKRPRATSCGKSDWAGITPHRSSIEGLVYFINDDGVIHVIRPGTTFDLVAKYELGEPCYASPAISDGQVFLRGFKHLFCIGQRVQ